MKTTSVRSPDFIAVLYYLTVEQGGRKTSASSGYRPHIKFSHSDYRTSAEQIFINQDAVSPGESVHAEIRILATDVFKEDLEEGMLFKFCEGDRTIGHGEIIDVINFELQKSRNHIPAELANFFSLELEFNKIGLGLYESFVNNKSVVLRMNDFPEFPMWTLRYGSKSVDFDDEPKYWKINYNRK